jgi:beta-glucosidase
MSDFIWGIRDGRASLEAGVDLEMPFRQRRAGRLPRELAAGRLDPGVVRTAATRILAAQLRHQAEVTEGVPSADVIASEAHRALARRVAARGMVLLRNELVDGSPMLPLRATSTGHVAVLGSLANAPNIGDVGSSAVRPPSTVSPLAGIRAALPDTTISSDDGSDASRAAGSSPICWGGVDSSKAVTARRWPCANTTRS